MSGRVEIQPNDDALIVFDGTVVEVFGMSDAVRVHVRGLERIEITEGWTGLLTIKTRWGPDIGLTYEKERLPELTQFAAEVNAVAESARLG